MLVLKLFQLRFQFFINSEATFGEQGETMSIPSKCSLTKFCKHISLTWTWWVGKEATYKEANTGEALSQVSGA